jgi:nitrate reductase molybdenum cofactor assembly chaperone NarJ/NarW
MDLNPELISLLLSYPDEEILGSLEKFEDALGPACGGGVNGECGAYMAYIRTTPLIRVQEEYTKTFDLDPSMSLNLSYHKWGDDRERGGALAALSRLYAVAGLEMSTGELPDYLPLVLEFLAFCPEEAGAVIRTDYGSVVRILTGRAKERGSRYAGLLGLAADLFGASAPPTP